MPAVCVVILSVIRSFRQIDLLSKKSYEVSEIIDWNRPEVLMRKSGEEGREGGRGE
jgi:hypothetical protein